VNQTIVISHCYCRRFDVESDEDWIRIGTLLGRLHNAGQKKEASFRLKLLPATITRVYNNKKVEEAIAERYKQKYNDVCTQIINLISPYFENLESICILGDFNAGIILHRLGDCIHGK